MNKKWKADLPIYNGTGWTTYRFWHNPEDILWEDDELSSSYKTIFFIIFVSLSCKDKWSWKLMANEVCYPWLLHSYSKKPLSTREGAKNQSLRESAKLLIKALGDLGFQIENKK